MKQTSTKPTFGFGGTYPDDFDYPTQTEHPSDEKSAESEINVTQPPEDPGKIAAA